MVQAEQKYFLIDFDSTFIKSEGLEELAKVALKNNPDYQSIINTIVELTNKGMDGTLPFSQTLAARLKLINANKFHVEIVAKKLRKQISSSILRNKNFFKKYKNDIYIISSGFKEFILPVVKDFGIAEDHIYANTFTYTSDGFIKGIDVKNPLAKNNGKINQVKKLGFKGELYIIGDGYTDYQLKEKGLVKKFIAFTENIEREYVTKNADIVAPSFDEFLYVNKLPMSISYPKNRISVLLLENIHNDAVINFEKEGFQVKTLEGSISEEELKQQLKDVSLLGVRSRTSLTKSILEYAPKLMGVGVFAIGTNHIDLKSSASKGVAVFNAPFSNSRSVVELAMGELIILMRRVFDKSVKMHNGVWEKNATGCHEIKGKTLGIIGYGNIGAQVGLMAESLGMKVIFYDKFDKPVLGNAQKTKSFEELLKKSDAISLHVDGNASSRNLIGEKQFKLMKPGVIFMNLSRGPVVDIKALVENIKNGKVAGAGIDVFPEEPKNNREPFISELQNLPNVILTPHIGGSTEEAQKDIARFVSDKLIDYINTGNSYLSVNLPNLQLPEQGRVHRLLHLHKNVPGILAQINGVLANNHINIVGQYLKTQDDLGYVITDVDKKYDRKVIGILKQIPETIRFRVLY